MLKRTGLFKQIDKMGRISVPAKLRKDLCIPIERDMEIFIYEDEDKNKYICYLIPDDEIEKKKKLARELLTQLDIEIPDDLAWFSIERPKPSGFGRTLQSRAIAQIYEHYVNFSKTPWFPALTML